MRLGESYKILNSDTAPDVDMSSTIQLLDVVNADYEYEIIEKDGDITPLNLTEFSKDIRASYLKILNDFEPDTVTSKALESQPIHNTINRSFNSI